MWRNSHSCNFVFVLIRPPLRIPPSQGCCWREKSPWRSCWNGNELWGHWINTYFQEWLCTWQSRTITCPGRGKHLVPHDGELMFVVLWCEVVKHFRFFCWRFQSELIKNNRTFSFLLRDRFDVFLLLCISTMELKRAIRDCRFSPRLVLCGVCVLVCLCLCGSEMVYSDRRMIMLIQRPNRPFLVHCMDSCSDHVYFVDVHTMLIVHPL